MLKSVGVVLGSYVLSIVLVLCSDGLLSAMFPGDFANGRVPSDVALMASTAFFVLVSILCAWVCARFAPGRATSHVFWFAMLGEAMGLFATIANWNKGWPHWYFLSWMVTWPISCYLGLLLGRRRARSLAVVA